MNILPVRIWFSVFAVYDYELDPQMTFYIRKIKLFQSKVNDHLLVTL